MIWLASRSVGRQLPPSWVRSWVDQVSSQRKPGASLWGWQCPGELSGPPVTSPPPSHFPFSSPVVLGAVAAAGSSHTKQNSRNSKLSRLLAVFSVPFCILLKVSGAGAQPHDLPGRILAAPLCAVSFPPPQLHFSSGASENPRRSLLERTVQIAKEEAEQLQPREAASI